MAHGRFAAIGLPIGVGQKADGGVEVEMNDVIAASKLLAEIAGLKDGDTTVNVNIDAASILSEVEARKAVSGSVADGS